MWVEASWLALAVIHAPPAAATFLPTLRRRLYGGVDERGPLGVILVHRGALFLAVLVACVFSALNADARELGTIVVGVSLVGFLVLYAMAAAPARRPLRSIAAVDAVGLIPLAVVMFDAWG
ncbi:hypothetical protein U91I_00316 [alpha proteobacterium U9-1i]|nr:hypothetical protein U91I_00316 [alpha proteobacterium U9-1i]